MHTDFILENILAKGVIYSSASSSSEILMLYGFLISAYIRQCKVYILKFYAHLFNKGCP